VTPCTVVVGYQSFRGPCFIHRPEDGTLVSYHNNKWCHNPEELEFSPL